MKKRKSIQIVLIIVLIFTFNFSFTFAQGTESEYSINEPYEFPITQYDDQWKEFETKAEALSVCQIPEEILNKMTTEALLETVLNYPFIIDYIAFNDYKDAADNMMRDFNGFSELLSREDLTEVLLEAYDESDLVSYQEFQAMETDSENMILDIESSNIRSNLSKFWETSNLEFIIAYDQIINPDYTEAEAQQFETTLSNKESQRCNSEIYSQASDIYLKFMAKNSDIMPMAGENIQYTTVKTPKGTSVSVIIRTPDFSSGEITVINASTALAYPQAELQRNPTVKYNCHSYAWYSQCTANKYWMNSPGAYTMDGSYSFYSNIVSPANAKVFYLSDDHSAIVHSSSSMTGGTATFISKWGEAGVYIHNRLFSPYDASSVQFYV